MVKKKSLAVISQDQGLVMTDEGLLIPGRLLRSMGEKIAVSFSPQLIVISSCLIVSATDKPERAVRRALTGEDVKRKSAKSAKSRRKTEPAVTRQEFSG